MKILIVGTGYVGLVTGAGFAEFGHQVVCTDINHPKIWTLRQGKLPFYEPGLSDLVERNIAARRLHFETDYQGLDPDLVFLCVGTPSRPDGSADLSFVYSAVDSIAKKISSTTIVLKSTVPVGTADGVRFVVYGVNPGITVASNPEFLKEGDAVRDFLTPDRVVIGTRDEDRMTAQRKLLELYYPIVRSNGIIMVMDNRSAELVKHASNAMLATRISFMNELANLAEKVGADIEHVRKAIGADTRIGPRFLFPGCGFGGSCFGKDLRALLQTAKDHQEALHVASAAYLANERQKRVLLDKLHRHFGKLENLRITIWGLSFKPETDDVRDAPSQELIRGLREEGSIVTAWDPAVRMMEDVPIHPEGMYAAAKDADALVLCTEWRAFKQPNFFHLKSIMRQPILFDGRNVWDPAEAKIHGFTYYGIGRK